MNEQKIIKSSQLILIILFGFFAFQSSASEFPQVPKDLQNKVAISIIDTDNGQQIVSYNSEKPMLLASNMKIITTYIALHSLGTEFKWETKLAYDGDIDGDTLDGNLYLIGGGDPSFTDKDLAQMISKISSLGLSKINGNIILDSSIFNQPVTGSELNPEPFAAYSVEPSGLLINYNLTKIAITIKNSKIKLNKSKIDSYRIQNNLLLSKSSIGCGDVNDYVTITNPQKGLLALSGNIPKSCNNKSIGINIYPNFEYNLKVIADQLKQNKIVYTGKIESGVAPQKTKLIYVHNSEAIPTIIKQMNKYSNNTIAKSLFLSLGAYKTDNQNTYQDSLKVYTSILNQSFNFDELTPENGSGLSRNEKLSASHMTDILYQIYQEPLYKQFINSLPTPGDLGTLQNDYLGYKQRLFVKTGTLNDTKAYSGFFITKNQHVYVVSFIANDIKTTGKDPQIYQFKILFINYLHALDKLG